MMTRDEIHRTFISWCNKMGGELNKTELDYTDPGDSRACSFGNDTWEDVSHWKHPGRDGLVVEIATKHYDEVDDPSFELHVTSGWGGEGDDDRSNTSDRETVTYMSGDDLEITTGRMVSTALEVTEDGDKVGAVEFPDY